MMLTAGLGVVCYTLCWPGVMSYVFYRGYKEHLYEGSVNYAKVWGFLYKRYERQFFWWHLVVAAHKFTLVVVKVFMHKDIFQGPVALILSFIFLLAQCFARPFDSTVLDRLQTGNNTAPSLHHHCTITAPSLHHHCTITAQVCLSRSSSTSSWVYHHCTITEPSLHHHCAITAGLLLVNRSTYGPFTDQLQAVWWGVFGVASFGVFYCIWRDLRFYRAKQVMLVFAKEHSIKAHQHR